MTWWEWKKKLRRALGYYRHSAEGRQENSIGIQREQVRDFAEKNNIEIVAEYSDAGKSGLTADRPGFQDLLEHVRRSNQGREKDLDYVLCLDVSRWGRFQKTDVSGYYETLCEENGVKVVFVVHGDLKEEEGDDSWDEDLWTDIGKPLERVLAKKHSKDLSKKVFAGAVKVSEQGNRAGGPPPFGMLRFEVGPNREQVGVMKPKQHKSYPNNRVRLIPDPKEKADLVREIFELFVTRDYSESRIAAELTGRKIPAPKGGKWPESTVSRILRDEQYIGSVVYNKTSSKLKTKRVRNPREKWIVKPGSYPQVVELEIFEAAQAKINARRIRMSREEMQEHIRFALAKFNMLSYSLMHSLSDMPPRGLVIREFGSLPEAIQSLYPETLERVRNAVRQMIVSETANVIPYEDFLVVNEMFTVKIAPAIPIARGYGHQWFFRIDRRPNVDITLGVPLRDSGGSRILGYFPFPRVLAEESLVCIADSSKFKIELYGYPDLRFLIDLIRWSGRGERQDSTNEVTP